MLDIQRAVVHEVDALFLLQLFHLSPQSTVLLSADPERQQDHHRF
jgi:hypothetical protein